MDTSRGNIYIILENILKKCLHLKVYYKVSLFLHYAKILRNIDNK